MDARDTNDFGWTNQQIRGQRGLADLIAEVVTKNAAGGMIAEGLATKAPLTVATMGSVALRISNPIETTSAVFGLDGDPVAAEGWHVAKAAEIGTLKAANVLLARWATDPSALKIAGLI